MLPPETNLTANGARIQHVIQQGNSAGNSAGNSESVSVKQGLDRLILTRT